MFKWIAGAVLSSLALAAVGPPLIDSLQPDNQATKLVQAAGRTNNQAGDLGSSYAEIVPITDPDGSPVSPQHRSTNRRGI